MNKEMCIAGICLALVFTAIVVYVFIYIGKANKKKKWNEYMSLKTGEKVQCIIDKQMIECRVMRKVKIGYVATSGISSFVFEFKHFVKKR